MLRITIAQLLKCVSFFLFFEIRNAKFLLPMNMKWVNCQQWKVICTCKCVFKLKMCLKERVSILKAWVFWKDARVHIFLSNFCCWPKCGFIFNSSCSQLKSKAWTNCSKLTLNFSLILLLRCASILALEWQIYFFFSILFWRNNLCKNSCFLVALFGILLFGKNKNPF